MRPSPALRVDGLLAVVGGLLQRVVGEVDHHAVPVAVTGFGGAGGDAVFDHPHELILRNEVLRVGADLEGIERIVGGLRQGDEGRLPSRRRSPPRERIGVVWSWQSKVYTNRERGWTRLCSPPARRPA